MDGHCQAVSAGTTPGYIVTNSDTGHVSWLPATVFHSIYKEAQ